MTVRRPLLQSRLEFHVHPVDAAQADFGAPRVAALVLVVDPASRARIDPVRVSALLGLTPQEGRVSALLAEGRSVREIAATTAYKESYVRWRAARVRLRWRAALSKAIQRVGGRNPVGIACMHDK